MKFFLFCLFFSLSVFVNAESLKNKNFGNAIVSEITSIYDGDTFRANIAGWPNIISYRIGIRISGIDTPELRSKCQVEKIKAKLAKQFTVENLHKAKKIELRNMKRGKYFRIVADVWLDDKNLAEALLKAGHAVKYDGGTKTKDWCKQEFTDVFKINASGGSCVDNQLTGFRIRVGNKVGIVTALHGVVGCKKIMVNGHYKNLKIDLVDIERDVAFLYSDELKDSLSQLQTSKQFPTERENLHVIGYPHGMSTQLHSKKLKMRHSSLETFNNLIPHADIRLFQALENRDSPSFKIKVLNIEGHLVHGYSGAPIFNRDNEVVGIVNGGLNNGYAEIVWGIPWLNINWKEYSQIRREKLEERN